MLKNSVQVKDLLIPMLHCAAGSCVTRQTSVRIRITFSVLRYASVSVSFCHPILCCAIHLWQPPPPCTQPARPGCTRRPAPASSRSPTLPLSHPPCRPLTHPASLCGDLPLVVQVSLVAHQHHHQCALCVLPQLLHSRSTGNSQYRLVSTSTNRSYRSWRRCYQQCSCSHACMPRLAQQSQLLKARQSVHAAVKYSCSLGTASMDGTLLTSSHRLMFSKLLSRVTSYTSRAPTAPR